MRADAREFLAAPRPERPLRAQGSYFSDSFWFRRMYYTQLRADCINFGSDHFRNTRLVTILHSMLYNRTQIFCTIGAYVDVLLFPQQGVLPPPCAATVIDESVVPRRRRCSPDLQRDFRVLSAMFFYGLILWLAVQFDSYPAPLFAHFFWQDRKSGSPKAQLQRRC